MGGASGAIEVRSDSTLIHDGTMRITGTLQGSGDLTIRGRQDNRFGYHIGLLGNASQYTGDLHVESGALRIGKAGSAGSGDVHVQAAGRLVLQTNSSSDPPLNVTNDVHLHGGTLYGVPTSSGIGGDRSPSVLHGGLVIHGESYVGASATGFKNNSEIPGLRLAGDVSLVDGAHVFGLSDSRHTVAEGEVALVDISGRLLVGADVNWHLLSSSLSISGHVRANSNDAAINFVGGRDQLRFKAAKFHADPARRLAVSVNGGKNPVNLAAVGNILTGQGSLAGDFSLASGAAVAPGNSAGTLTIEGDVAMGSGAILDLEIGGATVGTQYDRLIADSVTLDGAILRLELLAGFVPDRDDVFTVVSAGGPIIGEFANIRPGQRLLTSNQLGSFVVGYGATAADLNSVVLTDFLWASDFNGDANVDGADLISWKSRYGSLGSAPFSAGDADGDLDVDGADFLTWQRQFGGANASAGALPAPEPSSFVILSAVTTSLLLCRRRLAAIRL